MSDTAANLNRKIEGATDLQSAVRTMKALAASSIGQYEASVRALDDYDRTVRTGLAVCLRVPTPENARATGNAPTKKKPSHGRMIGAIIFGSDQGLVGQFNEAVADFAVQTLATHDATFDAIAVGERVKARLLDRNQNVGAVFDVPISVRAITGLVARLQIESETRQTHRHYDEVYLFHNRPVAGSSYTPVCQRLLPLDDSWQSDIVSSPWPTSKLPEVIGPPANVLRALVREYLFISLFRACAESLASENASRLPAMQRADKNIDDLLTDLRATYRRVRQGSIDEELFDVLAGYESLVPQTTTRQRHKSLNDHPSVPPARQT